MKLLHIEIPQRINCLLAWPKGSTKVYWMTLVIGIIDPPSWFIQIYTACNLSMVYTITLAWLANVSVKPTYPHLKHRGPVHILRAALRGLQYIPRQRNLYFSLAFPATSMYRNLSISNNNRMSYTDLFQQKLTIFWRHSKYSHLINQNNDGICDDVADCSVNASSSQVILFLCWPLPLNLCRVQNTLKPTT